MNSLYSRITFLGLLVMSGCTSGPDSSCLEKELQSRVGQPITLTGLFERDGRVGPYIQCGRETVYLVPRGSWTWDPELDRLQGRRVHISGRLQYRHFDPDASDNSIAHPVDYFYFEAETAQIRLE